MPFEMLVALMYDRLHDDGAFWLTVTGMSMYPTLRHEKDCVLVTSLTGDICVGDILLVACGRRCCYLHRVVRVVGEEFYIQGDALERCEGPFGLADVVGVAVQLRRAGRTVLLSRKRGVAVALYRLRFRLPRWLRSFSRSLRSAAVI